MGSNQERPSKGVLVRLKKEGRGLREEVFFTKTLSLKNLGLSIPKKQVKKLEKMALCVRAVIYQDFLIG